MATFYTDPSITLRGTQQYDLSDTFARLAQLRLLAQRNQQEGRVRDLQEREATLRLRELEREALEGGAKRKALAAGVTPGRTTAPAGLPRIDQMQPRFDRMKSLQALAADPEAAHLFPQVQGEFAAQDAAKQEQRLKLTQELAKLDEANLKNVKSRADIMGSLAQSVILNPNSYPAAKQQAEQMGMIQPGQLPDQLTPELLPQLQQWATQAMEVKDMVQTEETKRHNKAMEQRKAVPGVDVPLPAEVEQQRIRIAGAEARARRGVETAEDVADYADAVATGQMEITAVPMKVRGAVVSAVKESGRLIVSAKEREGIQALDIPMGIIADIEKYADKINTKEGVSARIGGAARQAAAYLGSDPDVTALQSKIGTLALLIRALGEKGTLAEGDVARAIALIPSVRDTKTEKDNKIRDLRAIMAAAKEVKTKGAAASFGAGGQQQDGGPQVGEKKQYNGATYKFDGTQWVKQ